MLLLPRIDADAERKRCFNRPAFKLNALALASALAARSRWYFARTNVASHARVSARSENTSARQDAEKLAEKRTDRIRTSEHTTYVYLEDLYIAKSCCEPRMLSTADLGFSKPTKLILNCPNSLFFPSLCILSPRLLLFFNDSAYSKSRSTSLALCCHFSYCLFKVLCNSRSLSCAPVFVPQLPSLLHFLSHANMLL